MPDELDNTNQAPEGQADVSAEEKLGKMMMGEEQTPQEEQPQEGQTEEQSQQVIEVGGKEYSSYEEAIDDYKEKLDRYGDPAELRKKLSQRNDKAKQYEQVEQFFQQNPKVAQVLQAYQQNPEVADVVQEVNQNPEVNTLIKAYKKGMINKNQLQKAQQYLSNEGQNQSKSNFQDPQQLQQFINQQVNQRLTINQIKQNMENQFNQLQNKENYKEYLNENDIDFDTLSKYAINRKLIDPQTQSIDMEKALNLYATENNDIQTLIQKTAENDVRNAEQSKQNAQVEKPSTKQQTNQSQKQNLPDWAQAALAPRNSGSGF